MNTREEVAALRAKNFPSVRLSPPLNHESGSMKETRNVQCQTCEFGTLELTKKNAKPD